MKEEKAKLIPLKRKKKTLVSKSGKGVVVKEPKGKSIATVETPSEGAQAEDLSIPELKESFDLDRVEKELRELDTQGSFLDQFFGTSEERILKKLKIKTELEGVRHDLRQHIIDVEKQKYTARIALLELKADLLEKEVMSDERVQKILLETKLAKLKIEKLRVEIEEMDWKRAKKQAEKKLEEHGKVGSAGEYDLKNLQTLGEDPYDKEDDKENKE